MNVKRLRIPSQILLDVVFSEKHFDINAYKDTIPDDARVVGVIGVEDAAAVDLILYSPQFPEVPEDCSSLRLNMQLLRRHLISNEDTETLT